MDQEALRLWLATGLEDAKASGKNQKGLALHIGISESAVSNILAGKREIGGGELLGMSVYLGKPLPMLQNSLVQNEVRRKTISAPITKIASGGVWREVGALMIADKVFVPIVPDPRVADLTQWADKIEGTDSDKLFQEGDYAIFVPYAKMREFPVDGDLVEVERRRDDDVMILIRRVRVKDGLVELWPESTDPSWQKPLPYPLIHKNESLAITGFFIGKYTPGPLLKLA